MSEDRHVVDELSGTLVPAADHRTVHNSTGCEAVAGSILKDARLAQGMDISTLAGLLKVPVHKLRALEQGRFDVLPDPVFTRALASSMCRILKLDPAPVLQQLPEITAFKAMPQDRGINTPFRTRSNRNSPSVWSHVSRPAIWLGLALVLGALVLVFLPFFEREFGRLQQLGKLEPNPAQLAPAGLVTTTVVTQVARSDSASGTVEKLPSPASGPAEVAVTLPSHATITAQPTGPDVVAASLEPFLSFQAKGTSSVKVTDATGALVFDRVLHAGESADLSGTLPLTAVISRASAIAVRVRGEAFDLRAVSQNNIARFEVN